MTQIICLANSWKHGERCIAGINKDTKKWIRPLCSSNQEAGIPSNLRQIETREPALLDILEIPLENNCSDIGIAPENMIIAPGKWQRIGQAPPTDLLDFCQYNENILHNCHKYVTVPFLQSLPFPERRTLELVYATKISVKCIHKGEGTKWKGSLLTSTAVLR